MQAIRKPRKLIGGMMPDYTAPTTGYGVSIPRTGGHRRRDQVSARIPRFHRATRDFAGKFASRPTP
jgi:hypothetical protein